MRKMKEIFWTVILKFKIKIYLCVRGQSLYTPFKDSTYPDKVINDVIQTNQFKYSVKLGQSPALKITGEAKFGLPSSCFFFLYIYIHSVF